MTDSELKETQYAFSEEEFKDFVAIERRKVLEEFVKRVKPLMTTIADQETLDTFLKISLKESEAKNV